MHKTWSSCISTTVLVLAENSFTIEVYARYTCFHFKLKNFLDFYKKKTLVKRSITVFPNLFELKDNYPIVMSTIIKKLQDRVEAP